VLLHVNVLEDFLEQVHIRTPARAHTCAHTRVNLIRACWMSMSTKSSLKRYVSTYTHIHTHMYTSRLKMKNSHQELLKQASTQTYTHAHIHAHIHKQTYMFSPTHTHSRAHAHTHDLKLSPFCVPESALCHYVFQCLLIHIHVHKKIFMHMYSYTHTRSWEAAYEHNIVFHFLETSVASLCIPTFIY